jgi:homoserine O-acetyltransferase
MTPPSTVPVTGAWQEGDPLGQRRLATLFESRSHVLEAGGRLAPITVAYETWGTLTDARDNAVLVLHALTGDSHAAGPPGPGHNEAGWWNDIVGPGKPIDTDRFFVLATAPNSRNRRSENSSPMVNSSSATPTSAN